MIWFNLHVHTSNKKAVLELQKPQNVISIFIIHCCVYFSTSSTVNLIFLQTLFWWFHSDMTYSRQLFLHKLKKVQILTIWDYFFSFFVLNSDASVLPNNWLCVLIWLSNWYPDESTENVFLLLALRNLCNGTDVDRTSSMPMYVLCL